MINYKNKAFLKNETQTERYSACRIVTELIG